jgi:hypothetical protein
MTIRIKKPMVIKIANAPARSTAEETGIIRRDIEEVSDCKWSERGKPVHNGTTPCGIRTVGAKKVQEAINE